MLDDFFNYMGSFVLRDAEADAETRKKESLREAAKRKADLGVNAPRNEDGTLKATWFDQLSSLGAMNSNTMSEIDQEMRAITRERKNAKIIAANPDIDFEGVDRRSATAVKDLVTLTGLNKEAKDAGLLNAPDFTTMPLAEARKKLAILQKGQALSDAGLNVSVLNDDGSVRTDMGNIVKEGKVKQQELSDEILKGSVTYKDQEAQRIRNEQISDRDFGLRKTQLLGEMGIQESQLDLNRAKLDYEMEQANLDRDYLNTKDTRDYNYRVRKDDMDRFDKMMSLILGGIKGIF